MRCKPVGLRSKHHHLTVALVRFRSSECTWMSRFCETRRVASGCDFEPSKSINSLHRGCVMLQTSKYRSEPRIVRRSISSRQSFEKRTFDIVVAIAGLLILSPLILLISLGSGSNPLDLFCVGINATTPIVQNLRYSSFERRSLIHPGTGPMRSNALRNSVRSCVALAWISSPS